MITIVSCNGGGGGGNSDTTTTEYPATINTLEETKMLLGDWYFYFWIITMFDEYYYLTDIDDSINDQGAHYVAGLNRYDDIVSACYWPDNGFWTLLDTGTIIDMFFVFYTDGDDILDNSCYYQISISTGDWSQCFDLYGIKFNSKSSSIRNIEDPENKIINEELRMSEIKKIGFIGADIKQKYNYMKQRHN